MMKKLLFGFIFSLICSTPALAEWEYRDVYDEMRDSHSYSALLFSEGSSDEAFLLILINGKNKEVADNASLVINGYNFDCKDLKPCKGLVKFDNNEIQELIIYSKKYSELAIIDNDKNFVNEIKNSKIAFVELPIEGRGTQQFKFKTAGLKWEVEQ